MSFVSILFPDTGDFLTVADPKTEAGQAAWERATAEAIEFSRNPGQAAMAKLVALVGRRSSLGDPTDPGFIENLSSSHRVVAMEQVAQVAATAHHLAGRNADGTRNPPIDGVVTMTPQGEAIISRPVTKASTADALRVAATQAGPQHADFAVRAAVAERETALRGKAAAPARQPTTTADLVPAQDLMLFKAARSGRRAAEADGLRARAAEYRALASVPGMPPPDTRTLLQAADELEQQAAG